jgi:protein SCO1
MTRLRLTTRLTCLLAAIMLACVGGGVVVPAAQASSDLATAEPLSPEMRVIDVDERRGRTVDPRLAFIDHEGNRREVGSFFDGKRPVLVTLNYFRCRVVCAVQLNGLAAALEELDWTPGDDNFRVVTLSIDPTETPEEAATRRDTILTGLGRGEDVDWQFLTGDPVSIRAFATQLGVGYAYDAEQDQYAHPAVAMFLTPDGEIAQYIYGLTFDPRDLKLALLEAGEGKIGTPMEKLFQSCFSYDPSVGRYGPWAFGIMRIGGVLTFFILATVILILWRRDRRQRADSPDSTTDDAEAIS